MQSDSQTFPLTAFMSERRELVEAELMRTLPPATGPAARVIEAMRYACEAGGKRLRPILALTACEACGGDSSRALPPAVAIEMIHTYSLIHDDLPAMDDDDLRRGRPSVHRAFDEATAILAGDALQALAFETAAGAPNDASAETRASTVRLLAAASGSAGMVGGQMADILAETRPVDLEGLNWIHRNKTGQLIAVSLEIGAVQAQAGPAAQAAMRQFGERLGLAFQIVDDLLDEVGTADQLGKTPGKDIASGKSTFPALIGRLEAQAEAERCIRGGLDALQQAGLHSQPLEALAQFTLERSH